MKIKNIEKKYEFMQIYFILMNPPKFNSMKQRINILFLDF